MHDVCQDNTGGVSGRYGSVEHWHGSGGAMMCGVMHAQMCGCTKADDDDVWVRMSGCMNSVGWVTDAGGGLSEHWKCMEMGNLDVFSTRCNSIPLLWTYSQEVPSSGVEVVVRQVDRSALENERWGWFLKFMQVAHGKQSGMGVGSAYLAQCGV